MWYEHSIFKESSKEKSRGVRSGERGGHAIGAALPIRETSVEVLAHFSKEMRGCAVLPEVNVSFLVIFF
jgi:hypothetical protein